MPKVLVLGAGIYQVPLLKTAKRMGLCTIVASRPGPYPGFSHADQVYLLDTTDQTAILNLARQEKIDAITTCGTDVAVQTIGVVCEELGLAGISQKCSSLCTDKTEMKRALEGSGVRTASFFRATTLEQAVEAGERLGWPVMFKAPDSSGSRGVTCVKEPGQAAQAFSYAKAQSRKGHVLVEEYLCGHEIGVDGCVQKGKIRFWPHDKLVRFNGFTNVPVGHVLPFTLPKEQQKDLNEQTVKAVRALGIEQGFFNMDVMLTAHGAFIIEVGARIGATCIPELIGAVGGFDCYEAILRYALGETCYMPNQMTGGAAAQLICAPKTGRFAMVKGLPDVADVAWSLDVKAGDMIRAFQVGPDRIGQILTTALTAELAQQKLKRIVGAMEIIYR